MNYKWFRPPNNPPPLYKNKTNTNFCTVLEEKNISIGNILSVWEQSNYNLKTMLMMSTSWLFQTM